MLKQGFITTLFALLFAVTPAMADDHKAKEHSGQELSKEYKQNLEDNRESANMPHAAHEMGEGNTFKNDENPKDKTKSDTESIK